MSPVKALRLALSRTADALWDLALVTQGVQLELLDQEGAHEAVPDGLLLVLLDGPDGVAGLVAVDRNVMTAMTEVQTILQVTSLPVEERAITHTDAAMMAPLIDGALSRFEANLEGHPDLEMLSGYRFGAMVEDSRTAGLLLEAARYRLFRVAMDLGGGKRQGDLQIMLPEREIAAPQRPEVEQGPGPHEQRLMLVPAQIDAVLCRMRLSLHKAATLKPGDLLELPVDALGTAELMVGQRHRMARGKMGQMNGFRAIRLEWPFSMAQHEVAAALENQAPDLEGPTDTVPTAIDSDADVASVSVPVSLDQAEEDLPDLPPIDFEDGAFEGDETAFNFDPDALDADAEWDEK
ncbi:flagellar motor switch protein FliM [Puniceibacterium sp. IMCC21224]|uniref:FliM/FliN family flagellar motor switch protein n=1 Tax=Puniceibacterium sp. IMCC21224 TaxID=1618204 RepID=UPI00065D4AA0|nr:flagellar motor switch protein FliM [Puniceibacterium sp. IMCC21224]KMK66516.1 Surface presentation of antigens (SPOA) [Puniceibacterium sp. IMCC21224]